MRKTSKLCIYLLKERELNQARALVARMDVILRYKPHRIVKVAFIWGRLQLRRRLGRKLLLNNSKKQ